MIQNLFTFLQIFALGELLVNFTVFKFLRKYFTPEIEPNKRIAGINISVAKGILERLVLFAALVMNIAQVLIVFGTLKIGSRFDKNNKIKNDYFIIGNFATLLIALLYYYVYQNLGSLIHLFRQS